jgi:hypothetical protein
VQTLDIEETQAAIGFFSNKIVEIVNSDKTNTAEIESSEEDSE